MSTVVVEKNGKQNIVLLKGAPERVLQRCSGYMKSSGEFQAFKGNQEINDLQAKITEAASQGLRVLGIAIANDGGKMNHISNKNVKTELNDAGKYPDLESGCGFVGYVCIKDPVRDEVKESIKFCRTAGVNVIMITGDAKETAINIASELNILSGANSAKHCYTGSEFEALSPAQKKKALEGRNGKVFCSVEPRHKRELVKILIEMGEIVAMTGDGVNDAPALK